MQTLFWDMSQPLPSNGMPTPAKPCESVQPLGSPACMCTREIFGCSIHPTTRDEWVASQQASLARILAQQERVKELQGAEADLSLKCSDQLTLFGLDSCSLKTAQELEQREGILLSGNWWRADTPGATESLGRLMLERPTSAIDGSALLPTLTVCGNYNRKGASATSGDGLITRLKMIPTLCARDARTVAGSQPPRRAPTSGLPLTWSLGKDLPQLARRGLKLNPMWAAWFMGWPMMWFRTQLKPLVTDKSRSRQRLRGKS